MCPCVWMSRLCRLHLPMCLCKWLQQPVFGELQLQWLPLCAATAVDHDLRRCCCCEQLPATVMQAAFLQDSGCCAFRVRCRRHSWLHMVVGRGLATHVKRCLFSMSYHSGATAGAERCVCGRCSRVAASADSLIWVRCKSTACQLRTYVGMLRGLEMGRCGQKCNDGRVCDVCQAVDVTHAVAHGALLVAVPMCICLSLTVCIVLGTSITSYCT